MQVLQELVKVITRHKLKKIEIISNVNNNTKLNKFYKGLESNEITNDEDAFRTLFGKEDSINSYYKLKYRFKTRLLNTLLLIDPTLKTLSKIERAYFRSNRLLVISNLLFMLGAEKSASELTLKGLKNSSKFEFTELSILFCTRLFKYYAQNLQDFNKYMYYRNLLDSFQESFQNEILANSSYCYLISRYNNFRSLKMDHDSVSEIEERLLSIKPKIETFTFIRNYYKALCLIYLAKREYSKIVPLCKFALKKLEEKEMNLANVKVGYIILLLQCNIQDLNFNDGYSIYNEYINNPYISNFNYAVLTYYCFILACHSKNFSYLNILLESIRSSKAKIRESELLNENFHVFEAFRNFLAKRGLVEITNKKNSDGFRIGKFLNEVPHFSKDKQGLNISILILQVLFLLHDKKYSKIIDRTDALNQYCYRYLRQDETYRSNCFIKMLIKMVKADFNRIRTERYVEPIWNKLKAVPIHVAEQGIEVEIIPYEDLWPMVLEMLDS